MFGKNRGKTDSKIRFQRRAFKQQLKQARGYKRPAFDTQERASGLFSILRTKAAAITAVVIIVFVYFAYVPNPFFIKKINITGLNLRQDNTLRSVLEAYFSQGRLSAQNNLLLLNKNALAKFILARDADLLAVNKLVTRLPATLEISVQPRQNIFFLTAPEGEFIVSNDGLISAQENSTSTASTTLLHIEILGSNLISSGSKFGNENQLNAIRELREKLPDVSGRIVKSFSILNFKDMDITVNFTDGAKIIFDYTNNLTDTLNKLRLLLNSIAPEDNKRLAYIDMRVKNRGYVCLKGTACAAPQTPIINNTATTTASSTLQTY